MATSPAEARDTDFAMTDRANGTFVSADVSADFDMFPPSSGRVAEDLVFCCGQLVFDRAAYELCGVRTTRTAMKLSRERRSPGSPPLEPCVQIEDRVARKRAQIPRGALQRVAREMRAGAAGRRNGGNDLLALVHREGEARHPPRTVCQGRLVAPRHDVLDHLAHEHLGLAHLQLRPGNAHLGRRPLCLGDAPHGHEAILKRLLERIDHRSRLAHGRHGGRHDEHGHHRRPVQRSGAEHAFDVPDVVHGDLLDGQREEAHVGHGIVAGHHGAHDDPVAVHDARPPRPASGKPVAAFHRLGDPGGRHRGGGQGVVAFGKEGFLKGLGELAEDPVVLDVEIGDPR
jgi:hypothetical protein